YYRLRQVDFDGQYSFSNAAIGRMATGKAICAYPSPLREFLQLTGPYSPEQTLKIRNVFWQVIYRGCLVMGGSVWWINLQVFTRLKWRGTNLQK
ncbi:MAG: hypothetical protein ACI974_001735, partial [Paraglaciecola sp.]